MLTINMMSLERVYYYLFYKFYRLFEAFETTRWLTDMKAIIVVMTLEIWIVFSLINYHDVIVEERSQFNFLSSIELIPFMIIILIKWFAFWRDSKWKDYVNEFDRWPKVKNRNGTMIVMGIVAFIVVNFVVSFYLNPPPNGWK